MTADLLRTYLFASREQWQCCLSHRVNVSAGGQLSMPASLGDHAYARATDIHATRMATDRYGRPLWRIDGAAGRPAQLQRFSELEDGTRCCDAIGAAAHSPRWIADRSGLWAFCTDEPSISRYELQTLAHELTIDISQACSGTCDGGVTLSAILDITSDGRDGLWLLVIDSHAQQRLLHLNAKGRPLSCWPVPYEVGAAIQLASVDRGATLMLLVEKGQWLALVRAADGSVKRKLRLGGGDAAWAASRLASDALQRAVLCDRGDARRPAGLVVLDGDGEPVDGPLHALFARPAPRVTDVAIYRDVVWLATESGVWCLDGTDRSGAREATAALLTPALISPPSDAGRGWLHAELDLSLPAGATLAARVAGTDDVRVADQAAAIAADTSATMQRRMESIWALLDEHVVRSLVIAGPVLPNAPVTLPLFESQHRWLWLGLEFVVPPGAAAATASRLRVRYPDISIAARLPAMFRGEVDDPGAFLRRLVGVLEATTQPLDERIASLGRNLTAQHAPAPWLNGLAAWLDLPWDDALPEAAQRALLSKAGALVEKRGTREGLHLLLEALVGDGGTVKLTDLTVDHAVLRLGGAGRASTVLPAWLAGASPRSASLSGKLVLGRAHLGSGCDPLAALVPTLRIELFADGARRAALQPLIGGIVAAYVPAGMRVVLRWLASAADDGLIDADGIKLDDISTGTLGGDASLGRTRLAGRGGERLDDAGLALGFRMD